MIIEVKVKPRSRESTLEPTADGRWLAHLRAAPVDGEANAELIALVARRFGCARTAVTIKSGATGRIKRVKVNGATQGEGS